MTLQNGGSFKLARRISDGQPHQRMAKKRISISVRDLVEFVLRTGDLSTNRDFFGPRRALEGTRGHQRVQESRPPEYQAEVPLTHAIEAAEFTLIVQGRVDGILRVGDSVLIEEIKTVQSDGDIEPNPLHWAQAKVYAFIFLVQNGLSQIDVQLTYLSLESDHVTPFRETFSGRALKSFFEKTTQAYIQWLDAYVEWLQTRDASIKSLTFPFPRFRPGQPDFISAASNSLSRQVNLFVEAPTGIGKTISALFPSVEALGTGIVVNIFFLTAKTIGRTVAEKALDDLRNSGLRLRSLTFTAREKLCFKNGQRCEIKTCPYAIGYFDRYKSALKELLPHEALTRKAIEEVAQKHQVCPSALSHDASRWVDAIICDYNYVFDPKVYLRHFFDQGRGSFAFLVDEAHNLIERAREMFSADLEEAEFLEVRRAVQSTLPRCARLLGNIAKEFGGLARQEIDEDDRPSDSSLAQKEAPNDLAPIFRTFLNEAEKWLVQNKPAEFREALLMLYFRIADFLRTLELYDERYVTLIRRSRGKTSLKLFCLDPSLLLQAAIHRGQSSIFFSATLSPMEYFCDLYGRRENDGLLQLASPFPSENLCVLVADCIATDFKRRASTLDEVAHSIASIVRAKKGNYLAYFPSYQYLNSVFERITLLHPDLRTLPQSPGMTEEEREVFLETFQADHSESLVGFAVMGGIFGEGIDLAGDRLVGAIIVGVGLPQLCLERDLIRDYFDAKNGAGFEYAYIFPGVTRVFQAVGRVIRSESDRGIVLLIDTRFAQGRYRSLFPAWWKPARVGNAEEIALAAQRFWNA